MSHYYDKFGVKITREAWRELFQNFNYRIVGKDEATGVSTVWLGLDHRYDETVGHPLIFETLCQGEVLTDEMMRYSTLEQAEAGHAEMVRRVRAATPVPRRLLNSVRARGRKR